MIHTFMHMQHIHAHATHSCTHTTHTSATIANNIDRHSKLGPTHYYYVLATFTNIVVCVYVDKPWIQSDRVLQGVSDTYCSCRSGLPSGKS